MKFLIFGAVLISLISLGCQQKGSSNSDAVQVKLADGSDPHINAALDYIRAREEQPRGFSACWTEARYDNTNTERNIRVTIMRTKLPNGPTDEIVKAIPAGGSRNLGCTGEKNGPRYSHRATGAVFVP